MNPRFEQWLGIFFTSAGICLLAAAGYLYFALPPGNALEVTATDLEIADASPGSKRDVALVLHNHSGRPMRVLGLTMC